MDRRSHILEHIDVRTMRGIEIGPSFSPVVPKASGADVTVVDHCDAAALREEYRVHGVDLAAIEEVDVVWSGGSLLDALGDREPFDFVIASHVFEHLPDPIGFLSDCERLLRPGGVLSLALPDNRYCFDCLRPLTSIGQWVDAHLAGRKVHTPGTVLDHKLHAAQRGGALSWVGDCPDPLAMVHDRAHVDEMLEGAAEGSDYLDVHAWVFMPSSFRYLVTMARALGFTSFDVAELTDVIGSEFFVSLRVPERPPTAHQRDADFAGRLGVMHGLRPVQPPSAAAARPRRVMQVAGRLSARLRR